MPGQVTLTAAEYQAHLPNIAQYVAAREAALREPQPALSRMAAPQPPVPKVPTLPPDRFRVSTSKTERRYGQWCDVWQSTGEIVAWWHEPLACVLGPKFTYTPDFLVQLDGDPLTCFEDHGGLALTPEFMTRFCDMTLLTACGLMCVEVKASFVFEERRAYDRLKTAARLFPMLRFCVVQWQSKQQTWKERVIPAA